ncbi:ParA family protein [Virgibacillus doumboii]|uniref:ParA family protein n=1 Tax=Virgibacillus doumboii TaxID=2697503 RepID=UPI0024834208|nr:AAA family ATPase [Virgibacillus doumboii]
MDKKEGNIIGVISIMNYKGGVGKTTLSANIAAELANRGKRVLLIDMDPQTNLTLSFLNIEEWQSLEWQGRTIKHWYDDFLDGYEKTSQLKDLVVHPVRVNNRLRHTGGGIDLICSHLELIHVDMEISSKLGGNSERMIRNNYLNVLSFLQTKLEELKEAYDIILIDCPPNFNLVTQNALAASDAFVVPAKADYLSTLGIDTLIRHVKTMEDKFNTYIDEIDSNVPRRIHPNMLGVIFTMVSFYKGRPIAAQHEYMHQVGQSHSCFTNVLREGKTQFATAPAEGIPVMLTKGNSLPQVMVRDELKQITTELLNTYGEIHG